MLMQIDGTFVFVVISFLIFLFIIKAVLFNPITTVIEKRNEFYDKNSNTEKSSKEKAQKLIEEKEQTIKNARAKAAEIIKVTSDSENKKGEEEIKEEKTKANDELVKNQEALEKASSEIKSEIKSEISTYVSDIISKILKEDIKVELNDEKINKHLHI